MKYIYNTVLAGVYLTDLYVPLFAYGLKLISNDMAHIKAFPSKILCGMLMFYCLSTFHLLFEILVNLYMSHTYVLD